MHSDNDIDARKRVNTDSAMSALLRERYRCPDDFLRTEPTGRPPFHPEDFNDGQAGSTISLPFDPTEFINNLRLERYAKRYSWNELRPGIRLLRDLYYFVRPWLSLDARRHVQRAYIKGWEKITFPTWPVDSTVERIHDQVLLSSMKASNIDRVPFIWFWPDGARNAVLMTHDIEGPAGYDFCSELMAVDKSFGIMASFQVVPEGSYKVTDTFLQELRDAGCEVNIHDLNHDGCLFRDRKEFLRRAAKINQYGHRYNAQGFRAAVLYRNLDWYDALDFSYDMSVPNVAHLDPQRGGCCTVMPYFAGDILELPLTTSQDYMLFHLLGDYSSDLWKTQTKAILQRNGLISFLIHPDYIREKRALGVYCDLLNFLRELATQERLWFALPGEVDQWWRDRSQMQVVNRGRGWQIEGPGSERAVLAFATAEDDHLQFEIASHACLIEREGS